MAASISRLMATGSARHYFEEVGGVGAVSIRQNKSYPLSLPCIWPASSPITLAPCITSLLFLKPLQSCPQTYKDSTANDTESKLKCLAYETLHHAAPPNRFPIGPSQRTPPSLSSRSLPSDPCISTCPWA
ncbi:hypothetical protein mRhiFer1_008562 [Rhinolophus ferrumequinum]|uniref:Uncharacterized protein n=1 Tax=Rhinolophus ferrumequinum TaxID=59479 RepID=A0A7J7UJV4_RHIFE|nr:hypothetical protein mRhiFer1_008562 [Rhinolophus ferrumequinum]